jgi:hypothetical protein
VFAEELLKDATTSGLGRTVAVAFPLDDPSVPRPDLNQFDRSSIHLDTKKTTSSRFDQRNIGAGAISKVMGVAVALTATSHRSNDRVGEIWNHYRLLE